MRPLVIAVLSVASMSAYSQASKPCEDLKAEIAKKMDANNVKSYTLEIVAKDKEVEGKVVGTCEGGTKKIVYSKTPASPKTPTTEPSKP